MAITVYQLAAAMRVSGGETDLAEPLLGICERLLGAGRSMVEQVAPNAPEPLKDEAIIRFAGYLYDQPNAGAHMRFSNAWRNSGGGALLARWVTERGIR